MTLQQVNGLISNPEVSYLLIIAENYSIKKISLKMFYHLKKKKKKLRYCNNFLDPSCGARQLSDPCLEGPYNKLLTVTGSG